MGSSITASVIIYENKPASGCVEDTASDTQLCLFHKFGEDTNEAGEDEISVDLIQKSNVFHQNWMTRLGDFWTRMQNNSDVGKKSLGMEEASEFFEKMKAWWKNVEDESVVFGKPIEENATEKDNESIDTSTE